MKTKILFSIFSVLAATIAQAQKLDDLGDKAKVGFDASVNFLKGLTQYGALGFIAIGVIVYFVVKQFSFLVKLLFLAGAALIVWRFLL